MKKRLFSLFMSLIMAISLVGVVPVMTAHAAYENTYKNTGNQRSDIIGVAKTQIGNTSGSKYTFGAGNVSWCAYFIVWCARQANIDSSIIKTNGWADADDFGAKYYSRGSYTPKSGDIIIFDYPPYSTKTPASSYGDHVGLVEYVEGSTVHTIEGNSSPRPNSVRRHSYSLSNSNIKGYGVPAYKTPYKPASPTNLKLSANNGKLNISWSAVSNANSYVVYIYTKSNCSEYAYKKEVKTTSISNISLPSGRYYIYVHALNSAGSSGCGPFNYLTEPRNLKVSLIGDVFNLKWDNVPGANCYDVIMTKPDGKQEWLHSTKNEKQIYNCIPGNYKFEVQSLYRNNNSNTDQIVGEHSNVISYNFNLLAPKNVVVNNNNGYLNISWDKVAGASCYDIIITKPNGNTDYFHCHSTNKTIYNYSYGNYKISVQGLYRKNESKTDQLVGEHSNVILYNYQKPSNIENPEHTHDWSIGVITKQPTCTATGIKTFTCSCGESYTETIAKKSHSYSTSWTIDKQATCTAEGSKSYHCTACGTKKDVTTIAKTAHKYDSGKITKQPTETATGVKTYTCTVCKTTKTEAIPRLAHKHSYMSKITKQPTCTSTGIKTFNCSCGDSYTETIAKKSHSYSTSWTIDKQATCTAEGSKSYHCTACGTKKDVTTIAKTAHKYDSGKITKQPTETATGVKTYTCTVCKTTKTEAIPRLAHKHSYMSKITKQPTCTSTGIKTFNCSCGDSYTETIAKTGHSYSTKVIVPTCTSQGYTLHTCSKCGSNYKNNYTDFKEHGYEHFVIEEPTCTDIGEELFICSYCGDSYTETISATGHKYTTTFVKPTYSAQGYTLHKCSTCGNSYKDNYKAKLTLSNITKTNFTSSANAVKMSWNKVSGATGYRVYKYNTSTKKWQTVANTKNTSYTFSKLKSGTTYKFTVRAYRTEGGKTYLSPKYSTFTTSTNPATVNFKLSAGSKKATVKWSKVTGATGYKVYYKTSKNGNWVLLKTCSNKTTSYTKTGLTKGKTYYFTVKAYRTVSGKTYNGSYTTKSVKVE